MLSHVCAYRASGDLFPQVCSKPRVAGREAPPGGLSFETVASEPAEKTQATPKKKTQVTPKKKTQVTPLPNQAFNRTKPTAETFCSTALASRRAAWLLRHGGVAPRTPILDMLWDQGFGIWRGFWIQRGPTALNRKVSGAKRRSEYVDAHAP